MTKKILIRLFAYIFSIIMIYMGCWMIDNFENWDSASISGKQLVAGFGLILVGLVFIVTDVIITIKEFRNNK